MNNEITRTPPNEGESIFYPENSEQQTERILRIVPSLGEVANWQRLDPPVINKDFRPYPFSVTLRRAYASDTSVSSDLLDSRKFHERQNAALKRLDNISNWKYPQRVSNMLMSDAMSGMASADTEQDAYAELILGLDNQAHAKAFVEGTCPLTERVATFLALDDMGSVELARIDGYRKYSDDYPMAYVERVARNEVRYAVEQTGGVFYDDADAISDIRLKVRGIANTSDLPTQYGGLQCDAFVIAIKRKVAELPGGSEVMRRDKYLLPLTNLSKYNRKELMGELNKIGKKDVDPKVGLMGYINDKEKCPDRIHWLLHDHTIQHADRKLSSIYYARKPGTSGSGSQDNS